MVDKVDLNALANNAGSLDITITSQETVEDAKHRRRKDLILFSVSLFIYVLLILVCLYILTMGNQTPDEKKIWAGVLASMVSGMIGYAIGKK